MPLLEMYGYLGSILVALSLMMSNIRRLRWINLVGAAVFSSYGLLIGAWPVAFLNGFICLIDVVHLYKMSRQREYFSLQALSQEPSPFLASFLDHYREDIRRFLPEFREADVSSLQGVWILRDLMPVGLFLYKSTAEDGLHVELDYVVPAYRDLKNGRWMYHHGIAELQEQKPVAIRARPGTESHQRYLRRLGFRPCPGGNEYCLSCCAA